VTPSLVVYDDVTARRFAPFSLTRPLGTVRAGAEIIAQRWAGVFAGHDVYLLSSPHLEGFPDAVSHAPGILPPGTIIANSRCVVALGSRATHGDVWRVGEEIAAVRLAKAIPAEAFRDGSMDLEHLVSLKGAVATLSGRWMSAPWDLIGQLPVQLTEDVAALAESTPGIDWQSRNTLAEMRGGGLPPLSVSGQHKLLIEEGAHIEPHVVFDTSAGDVIVCAGAHISAFSRIAGPCYVGRGTHILGGRISGSSIGDDCRVHGDVSASIFIGHANKGHEGFVGHSVIGRWANLGAGTTTSNLKNSYGAVRMWTPEGERGTDLTFLGSLIGDHAKLGIGTMLGTGTVIGAGANIFGNMRPPKRVPPFAWGDAPPYGTFTLPKFLDVAGRVMERRKITLDENMKRILSAAYALAPTDEW
jgi:UDP-N-acetylglucosamine diphosphorylase / glucose-1-phosphate thymidylyltransferase / UDP-N-acetylgalactosamine diphosphorylase / glucosamine-1-phosphate N-acetyltransferase / galactosamine-1-phosphate N-acetyltransferase